MVWLKRILLSFLALVLVVVVALFVVLHTEAFWHLIGKDVLKMAQQECRCSISVGGVRGNLFNGLYFENIVIATAETEVIRAKSLEIQLSFWSLFKLELLLDKVAVQEPKVNIRQESDGEWDIVKIIPPAPSQLRHFFAVKFSDILITDGRGEVVASGQTQDFSNLNAEMNLAVYNPMTARQTVKLGYGLATATTVIGNVSLGSRFTYGENYLNIELLEVKSGDRTLMSLAGKADLSKGGQIQGVGQVNLSPEEIHRVWDKWPQTWGTKVGFQMHGTRSHFHVALAGEVQKITFDVEGELGTEVGNYNYDITGQVKNINTGILTIFDKSLEKKLNPLSPLNVNFHVKGDSLTLPPANFTSSLDIAPFKYGSVQFDQVNVNMSGDNAKQDLKVLVDSSGGHIALDAAGPLFEGKGGKIAAQVAGLNPKALGLSSVPEGTALSATFNGDISAPGFSALSQVKVAGDLKASGTIGRQPLEDAHASLVWEKNRLEVSRAGFQVGSLKGDIQGSYAGNTLDLTRADLQLGNLTAQIHGTLAGENVNFAFQARSASGGNWPIPAQVGGQLSAEGAVTGSLTNPQVTLKARGQGLAYDQYHVKTLAVNVNTTGWPLSQGHIALQATGVRTPVGVFPQATARADGTGKVWNFDLKAGGPGAGPNIEVRGGADLARDAITVQKAVFNLDNIKARNDTPVEIVLSSGLEIKPATFEINQGKMSLQARITAQQAQGSLSLQNLQLESLAPKSFPLQGIVTAQATLSGTGSQPVIHGDIRLGTTCIHTFEVQAVQTSFTYQDNRLSLNGGLTTKEKGLGLTWSGYVPMRLSLVPFAYGLGQGEMQIAVQGQNVNLSLLPSLVKGVDDAKGAVNVQVKINGTMSQPRVSGQVNWSDGYIKLRATGATYTLQPGEILMKGDRITIPQLTLRSDGTATLTGDIVLNRFTPSGVKARLQFTNFKAVDKLHSDAYVDGAIDLDGRWPHLVARGSLTIPKADFSLGFLQIGPTKLNKDVILVGKPAPEAPAVPKNPKNTAATGLEVWKDLAVDISVSAPNNVRVDDPRAKVELAVKIQVRKQPGQELLYAGEIHALNGHVSIAGREFQVVRGNVTLPPVPGAEPVVDGRIEYQANEVKLYADVSGPVSNPRIVLGGEPSISESDWMAILLYGKPVAYLSREERNTAQAGAAVGGLAARLILKDFLGLTPSFAKGLTISYQQRNDPLYRDDPYQVVIQYRINRNFSVQSQVGGRNTGGDVFYNLDF